MAPSEDDRSLAALAADLADATDGEGDAAELRERRRERVFELAKRRVEDVDRETELTDDVLDAVLPLLDADDPGVRAGAALVVRNAAEFDPDGVTAYEPATLVDRLLDLHDDESDRVRQILAHPKYVEAAFLGSKWGDDPDDRPDPPAAVVDRYLGLLRDPLPAARKRVGDLLDEHRDEVVRAHPEPERAVETLVAALEDGVTVRSCVNSTRPRLAAIWTLQALVEHEPELVTAHLDDLLSYLPDERAGLERQVARLLADLLDAGAIDHAAVEEDVLEALAAGRYPRREEQTAALLVTVALRNPEEAETVAAALQDAIGHANDTSTVGSPAVAADALGELVRETDRQFGPVAERLAVATTDRSLDEDDVDPLVVLAPDEPAFVADELRSGVEELVAGDPRSSSRFDGDLLAAVAAEAPAAVESALTVLADAAHHSSLLRDLEQVADVAPDRVGAVLPDTLDAIDHEPPVSKRACRLVAKTADAAPPVAEAAVAAIAETIGPIGRAPERRAERRYWAARAAVALADAGHDVPERVAPFVEASRDGDLDEQVDPLDLDAAERAGYPTDVGE